MSTIKPFNSQQHIFKPLGKATMLVARELKEAVTNDPALAMRLFATEITPTLLKGVDDTAVREAAGQTIVPAVRAGLLAANTVRAIRTFKDPTAGLADKSLDVIRVVSDTAGLLGGLAMLFTPQYSALGAQLMGASYSVDVVSHSIRSLQHGAERYSVLREEFLASKPDTGAAKPTTPEPAPAPAPKPTATPLGQPLAILEQPRQLSMFGA